MGLTEGKMQLKRELLNWKIGHNILSTILPGETNYVEKRKRRIRDIRNRVRRSNIHLLDVPEREEREMGKEMAENLNPQF